jgi:hypothetical protein
MLGIIIAVICSNWVGEAIHSDGVYETDLEAVGCFTCSSNGSAVAEIHPRVHTLL